VVREREREKEGEREGERGTEEMRREREREERERELREEKTLMLSAERNLVDAMDKLRAVGVFIYFLFYFLLIPCIHR
jgi:hypothetical protein